MLKKSIAALVVAAGLTLTGAGAASADAGSTESDPRQPSAGEVRQVEEAKQDLLAAIEKAQKAEAEGHLDGAVLDIRQAPEVDPQYSRLDDWLGWVGCMIFEFSVAWSVAQEGHIEAAIKIALNADDKCGVLWP